jgi:hypothetical protein
LHFIPSAIIAGSFATIRIAQSGFISAQQRSAVLKEQALHNCNQNLHFSYTFNKTEMQGHKKVFEDGRTILEKPKPHP